MSIRKLVPLRAAAPAIVFSFTILALAGGTSPSVAQSDQTIVPAERIGAIRLGMSTQALYALMGDPDPSGTHTGPNWAVYTWGSHTVSTDEHGNVTTVTTTSPLDSLSDGLRVGKSELALRAQRPSPVWSSEGMPGLNDYCYDDGLRIGAQSGSIISIKVQTRGCGNQRGHFRCYRYQGNTVVVNQPCVRE